MSGGAGPRVVVNTLDDAIEKGLLVDGISHADMIGAVSLRCCTTCGAREHDEIAHTQPPKHLSLGTDARSRATLVSLFTHESQTRAAHIKHLIFARLTLACAYSPGIADKLICLLVAWLKGNSLLQTVFTCLYVSPILL